MMFPINNGCATNPHPTETIDAKSFWLAHCRPMFMSSNAGCCPKHGISLWTPEAEQHRLRVISFIPESNSSGKIEDIL
jgi:hypothetical protein